MYSENVSKIFFLIYVLQLCMTLDVINITQVCNVLRLNNYKTVPFLNK